MNYYELPGQSSDWIDQLRPHLGRHTRVIRDLPVDELSPSECKRLLVHSHACSPERHRAYWEKWWDWFRAQPPAVRDRTLEPDDYPPPPGVKLFQ